MTTLCANMGSREPLQTHKACVSWGEALDPMYLQSSPGVLTGPEPHAPQITWRDTKLGERQRCDTGQAASKVRDVT